MFIMVFCWKLHTLILSNSLPESLLILICYVCSNLICSLLQSVVMRDVYLPGLFIYVSLYSYMLVLCSIQLKVNQPMIQAETNLQLQLSHPQPLVMQKVIHPLPSLKKSLKLLLVCENSHLMILSWQQEILDLKVFWVKEVLVVCSRGGLKKMELLR